LVWLGKTTSIMRVSRGPWIVASPIARIMAAAPDAPSPGRGRRGCGNVVDSQADGDRDEH
jgi:hypothetical protein